MSIVHLTAPQTEEKKLDVFVQNIDGNTASFQNILLSDSEFVVNSDALSVGVSNIVGCIITSGFCSKMATAQCNDYTKFKTYRIQMKMVTMSGSGVQFNIQLGNSEELFMFKSYIDLANSNSMYAGLATQVSPTQILCTYDYLANLPGSISGYIYIDFVTKQNRFP